MATVVTERDKQTAKEIMIAYIQHGGTVGLFPKSQIPQDVEPFEKVWSRILKTVSADSVE